MNIKRRTLWLATEAYLALEDVAIPFIIGALTGVVIGGIGGYRLNRQVVRAADELLEQVREFQEMYTEPEK